MPILDARGREWSSGKPQGDALGQLAKVGIVDRGKHYEVDKATMQGIRANKARSLAMTRVPNAPRNLMRDVGGMAFAKGSGRWPHISIEMLRDLRERAPILAPIHNARHYQVRRLSKKWTGQKGTVGYRVVHKDHHEGDAIQPEGMKPYIQRFERMLESPSPTYGCNTTGSLMTLLWEDLATINRPTVEIIHSAVDPKRVVQFRPVDGGIIWPTLLWIEQWKKDHPNWRMGFEMRGMEIEDEIDIVSAAIDYDLHGAEYVLVRDGIAEQAYPRNKLIVAPIMNRTDIRWVGYPPSHLEQAIHLIAAFISTFDYNATFFTKGMMAEFILGVPADLHADDVDAFIDMLREATQGTQNAWQPPILPVDSGQEIQKIDLKKNNTEMGFEVWLSLLVALNAAVYRMDPSTINAKPWDGGQSAKLSDGGGRTEEIALAKEEGLQGDISHLTEEILNPLAKRCHPDLRVVWEYGDFDPRKEAEINEIRARTSITRNEVRLEDGKKPRGYWVDADAYAKLNDEDQEKFDQNIWNWPTDQGFASAMSQQAMAKMQEEQPEEQPPGGDGFGGEDDGFGGGDPNAPPGGDPNAPPGGQPAPFGAPQPPPGGQPDELAEAQPMNKGRSTVVHISDL
tara:strand:- start:2607 stop:4478 length:1872 start_codon:yes stop_codon:yes gene_type:complete